MLRWMAACVLLVLLIFGVGSVIAFVLGQATSHALAVGAVLVTVVIAAIMIGGLVWTPWLTIFARNHLPCLGATGYGTDGTTSR